MTHWRLWLPASRFGWAGLGLAGGAVGLLWLAIGLTIRDNFRNAAAAALRETTNLARTLEGQVGGRVETIDTTLRFGQTLFAQDPAGFTLGPWSVVAADPGGIIALLVGPDGFARATRDGPLPHPIDFRQRPNVAAHLADPTSDALQIGPPILGPVTNRPVIAFSRALRRPDGGFGGVMVLAMDADLFSRLHRSLELRNGRILLIGLDGIIRARVPDAQALPGSRLPDPLLAPFRAGTTEISELRRSAIDGTAGFVSLRRVAGYPLLVSVGLEAATVLDESRLRRDEWLLAGLLLTLLTMALCWAIARSRRVQANTRAALEGTFASIGHGIMMVDPDGRVVLSNARVDSLLGLPPGLAVPGRPLAEIVAWQEKSGEYQGPVPQPHHDSAAPRQPGQPFIWERTRPDGRVLEIRVDHLADGSYVRSWTDVTEARRAVGAIAAARDAAEAARAALITAFENAPLGILLLDADRRVQFMNRVAHTLLALPPDLVRPGTPARDILQFQMARGDLDEVPEDCLPLLRAFAEDQPVDLDMAYERPTPDGRMVEVRSRGLPDGRIIRTFTDISARHAALREQQGARSAAEAALRSRSEFLGTVSHELLTPLNAVIGLSQVMLMQPLTEVQRADLRLIEDAGQQLLALVNDILDVTRLEHGRLTLREQGFDPAALLREAAALAEPRAVARGLGFALRLDPGLPAEVFGDDERLRQVVLKLLDNALKFTGAGDITLAATILAEDAAGWRLEVSVADTGIGIPAEDQARLFVPFVQADGSAARRFNGAGLGLAVCRMLLEAMDGTITVESMPGQGSTFRCAVPLRRSAAGMVASAAA